MEYFRQPIFVIAILLCLTSICPDCYQNRQEQFTGQDIWRLEEGGILWGFLRSKYPSFPLLLEENGYFMGGFGKQYWPARFEGSGVHTRSTGNQYRQQRFDPHPPEGLS